MAASQDRSEADRLHDPPWAPLIYAVSAVVVMAVGGVLSLLLVIYQDDAGAGFGLLIGSLAASISLFVFGWSQVTGRQAELASERLDQRLQAMTELVAAQLGEQREINRQLTRLVEKRRRWF